MNDLEISAADLKQRLDNGEKLVLVDVREPWENAQCRIEGADAVRAGFATLIERAPARAVAVLPAILLVVFGAI